MIGLKKDYAVKSENIELKYYRGIFFPEESYYNCDMLPKTWIEFIDKSSRY
jgi:hypothetical protein